jgi:hypothetical protein
MIGERTWREEREHRRFNRFVDGSALITAVLVWAGVVWLALQAMGNGGV